MIFRLLHRNVADKQQNETASPTGLTEAQQVMQWDATGVASEDAFVQAVANGWRSGSDQPKPNHLTPSPEHNGLKPKPIET